MDTANPPSQPASLDRPASPAVLVIDVRSPQEFAAGHVSGAVNLPLNEFAQKIAALAADKDAPIILYCASGARSGMAVNFLQQSGYTAVSNGINASLVAGQLQRTMGYA